jgi:predicted metal-dependent hydrolase
MTGKMRKRDRIQIGRRRVEYEVIRTGRKRTVGIEMTPQGKILVRAPRRLSHAQIREILSHRSQWIRDQMDLFQEKGASGSERRFESGERFLFLGRWFPLQIHSRTIEGLSVFQNDGLFEVHIPHGMPAEDRADRVRAALVDWYRRQAGIIIHEQVAIYAPKVGVPTPSVRIGNARRTWGSCSPKGRLSFSWRIIMAELSLVDYVVAHELCHLVRRDHSRDFWKLVASILPDHSARRTRLRLEGPLYDF